MRDVLETHAGVLEHAADGVAGEARVVLEPIAEPLFRHRGDELAVDDNARRGVRVL